MESLTSDIQSNNAQQGKSSQVNEFTISTNANREFIGLTKGMSLSHLLFCFVLFCFYVHFTYIYTYTPFFNITFLSTCFFFFESLVLSCFLFPYLYICVQLVLLLLLVDAVLPTRSEASSVSPVRLQVRPPLSPHSFSDKC